MAVTGHKSVQSLLTYQRVDTEEKFKMGQTLTKNVTSVPEQLALPSTEKLAVQHHLHIKKELRVYYKIYLLVQLFKI